VRTTDASQCKCPGMRAKHNSGGKEILPNQVRITATFFILQGKPQRPFFLRIGFRLEGGTNPGGGAFLSVAEGEVREEPLEPDA